MSTKLSAGKARRLTDSQPKYLGTKLYDGQKAHTGNVIIRQRGAEILPGKNVKMGHDYTLYAVADGSVKFSRTRKINFSGKVNKKKVVNVLAQ
jgi:large subunit ribosomal protein L27